MAIDVSELVKHGADVAAAINEDFLNEFSASHHKNFPSIYTGRRRFIDFDNDIEIIFNVKDPIEFDFSRTFSATRFRKLWKKHIEAKGSIITDYDKYSYTPPNIFLTCPSVEFEIVIYEGHTNTQIISVDFDWSLEASAALQLVGNVLKLDPLRVSFSTSSAMIAADIAGKIASYSPATHKQRRDKIVSGDPSDPVWCAKLEKMLLLLLNQMLSSQMTSFIRGWELPRAIEIVDGVSLNPVYIGIQGDDLVVGAQIVTQPIGQSYLQPRLDALIQEFAFQAQKEYAALSDEDLRLWSPDRSETIRWLTNYREAVEAEIYRDLSYSKSKEYTLAATTLQVLFNDKLFDVAAKKYLAANNGWRGSKELDRLVKGEAGWWLRIENSKAAVISGGVQINSSITIGGDVRVCHFNVDPKEFGQWKCHGVGIELYPVPDFGIQVLPTFPADGVYLAARLLTTGIGLRFLGLPGWANDIVGWLTGNLTRPLLAVIAAVIALFRIKILTYPHHFPGTGLLWTPNFSTTPTNLGPYLVFSASPDFE